MKKKQQTDAAVLFDAWCEVYSTSDLPLPDTLREIQIDELIRKNKQAAYHYLYSDIPLKKRLVWLNKLFSDCGLTDYEQLLGLLKENSKLIRRNIERLLLDKEKKTRKLLEQLYPELDEESQNWARQLFKYWDNTHASAAKIKFRNKQAVIDYCSKHIELYCTQQIAWLPQKPYTRLHWANETDVDEFVPRHVIRYVLSEYMSLNQVVRLHACDAIVPFIEEEEWQAMMEELFRYWQSDSAEANRRMLLLPYCFYGSEQQIAQLSPLIKSWSRASRKQLSRFVLKLLGIKSSPNALRILNEWMEISPNGTYRTTSWNAFRQAAIRKGMTVEELADQIIPTFGFNSSAEKEVSYGTRTFRVTLNPDFTLSVFDLEKQKVSKSLPAPTKHDDRKKAEKAREELSTLNKVVKTQTKIQRKRLEQSLKNGRTWPRKIWQTIFIENPVMRYITTGLVWGVYKEGQLRESFRYMENGKCITVDEKEFILSDDAIISLVHPVDLTSEILSGWKKQLDDQGITPLLPQLTAPVYYLSEEEKQVNTITRYSGKQVYISNIYNFETADITTRIENDILYIIDRSLNIVIQLPFVTEGNEVLLKEIYFSSWEEDEDMETIRLPKNEKLPLSAIPERIICSILNMLINAFSLEK
ncbi:DUF4132 domain-containing protein [Parabacteroides faecis]|uniref:DUF4132 domain-containing protein n=1 Tax=Parabacteroides faecis TaxID=1217282 RepID=UPI0021645BF2|nr:DUF4132 domain-containing protein [Parabacteroides faecis]MCS2893502.1 DUF4132 domain-containing protein [Parabacteroides faecis]UVQ47898.1 DUF4132 domain-containing protein [Parabacteroides faecis]